MKLYNYYRSSASYRVRIALNIKQINYEVKNINLVPEVLDQRQPAYLALNPQGLVPTLEENGHVLCQSLSIIEYLEEICPNPPILPKTPLGKAYVRGLAMIIASDMHPLNNLRVLQQLKSQFNASEENIQTWYHLWLQQGFDAFEKQLANQNRKHPVCYGSTVTIADICLIPQVYNAKRFGFPLHGYPLINEIADYCNALPDFKSAAP